VGGGDDLGPALALVGGVDTGPGPAQGLFEELEGVFQVEAVQEGLPQAIHLGVGELGSGVPQPHRFGVTITGQPLDLELDDAALDEGQRALVRFPRRAVPQPRVQPVPSAGAGGAVAAGGGEGDRIGLRLGRGLGQRELGAVLGRAPRAAGRPGRCWEVEHAIGAEPVQHLYGQIGQQERQAGHVVASVEDDEDVRVPRLVLPSVLEALDDLP